jgi:hypothetical protein
MVVLAKMKPQRLADRNRDPFKDTPEVLDLQAEVCRRLGKDPDNATLQHVLHLVHQYNESHSEFERLKYLKTLSIRTA